MRSLRAFAIFLAAAAPAAAQDMPLTQVLLPGESWKQVAKGYRPVGVLAADLEGRVYLATWGGDKIDRLDGNKVTPFVKHTEKVYGLSFGPGNRLYGAQFFEHRVVAWDAAGKEEKIVEGIQLGGITVTAKGDIYGLDFKHDLFHVAPNGKFREVRAGKDRWGISAILAWPDGGTLLVGQWAFRIEKGGALSRGEPYYRPRKQHGELVPNIVGLTMDTAGRGYMATPQGVQIFDPTGRLCGVLRKPESADVTAVCFGGTEGNLLYIACGNGIYARKTKATGAFPLRPRKKPKAK